MRGDWEEKWGRKAGASNKRGKNGTNREGISLKKVTKRGRERKGVTQKPAQHKREKLRASV